VIFDQQRSENSCENALKKLEAHHELVKQLEGD
jgi:hypothetical protein